MGALENKLNLVQLIVESEDKTFINRLLEYALSLKKEKPSDSVNDYPEYVLEEVRLAMEELDNGTDPGIPHEVMLQRFKKDFPNLNI